jgi:acyl carrier protein
MPSPPPHTAALIDRLADILECAAADLDEATVFRNHPHWDSLAALSLIAMLDSAYGVILPHTEFERLQTIGDLDASLRARQLASPSVSSPGSSAQVPSPHVPSPQGRPSA